MQLRCGLGRKANVTVEFALLAVFFLLPLMAVCADFVCVINARAQLNTALQALIYYAWSTGSGASGTQGNETGIIGAINAASDFHITYVPGTMKYACVTGSAGNYTVPAALSTSTACATGNNLFYYEQYTLTTNVTVPFPVPFHFANPYPLSVTGAALVGHAST
jgi:hypothetical protein